jgi:hypothetical protein
MSRFVVSRLFQAVEDGTLTATEHDKKHRRKQRTFNDDDDELNVQQDDVDSRHDELELDGQHSKSSKQQRTGKRKIKDITKRTSHESIPSKLYKQMTTLFEFVIKYRDK